MISSVKQHRLKKQRFVKQLDFDRPVPVKLRYANHGGFVDYYFFHIVDVFAQIKLNNGIKGLKGIAQVVTYKGKILLVTMEMRL